jgi:hypothetical protein
MHPYLAKTPPSVAGSLEYFDELCPVRARSFDHPHRDARKSDANRRRMVISLNPNPASKLFGEF